MSYRTVKPKVEFAMFGIGRAGSIHLRNISRHPLIRLKWIVEKDLARAYAAMEDLGLENVSVVPLSETTEVLADKSVKAVVICVPTTLHQNVITQALKAGKAVFCEKPIASTVAAAAMCYDVADACGLPLFCAFNRRFDPHFSKVIKRVKAGDVGNLRYIRTTMRDLWSSDQNSNYFTSAGSIFLDLGVHGIDMVCTVAGELPATVTAQGHAFEPQAAKSNDYDQAVVTLKFANGLLATIEISRLSNHGYDQRLEVSGCDGMLEVSNVHITQVKHSNNTGTTQDSIWTTFSERYEASYYNELVHFVNVIEGQEVMSVTREHGISAIRIVEACEKSAKTGTIVTMTN